MQAAQYLSGWLNEGLMTKNLLKLCPASRMDIGLQGIRICYYCYYLTDLS